MNFAQAMNKLQNFKIVARPSFVNGQYLRLLEGMNLICRCSPLNPQNPLSPYQLNVDDFNATDWIEVPA